MKKPVFFTELTYAAGLLLLALGTALTAYGDLGISMVVAPAYILHLQLSRFWPFFSFGMAEYLLQGLLLLAMVLFLRKDLFSCLFSLGTAVLYGFALDAFMALAQLLPQDHALLQPVLYIVGVPVCAAAISLLFQSYFPPEAYELLVKELSVRLDKPIPLVKTLYDCGSLLLSLLLSLMFFGDIRGIGIGTVVCAFLNGFLIRQFSQLFRRMFIFRDGLSLRIHFQEREENL